MKPFAAKLKDGNSLLGLAISAEDLALLTDGVPISIDLESIGVGLWFKEADGGRSFVQPRDSKIKLIVGDSNEAIGRFLGVQLP